MRPKNECLRSIAKASQEKEPPQRLFSDDSDMSDQEDALELLACAEEEAPTELVEELLLPTLLVLDVLEDTLELTLEELLEDGVLEELVTLDELELLPGRSHRPCLICFWRFLCCSFFRLCHCWCSKRSARPTVCVLCHSLCSWFCCFTKFLYTSLQSRFSFFLDEVLDAEERLAELDVLLCDEVARIPKSSAFSCR